MAKFVFDLATTTPTSGVCSIDKHTNFHEIFETHGLKYTFKTAPNFHTEYTLQGPITQIMKVLHIIFHGDEDTINDHFEASQQGIEYALKNS